jgi:hypothetical protein
MIHLARFDLNMMINTCSLKQQTDSLLILFERSNVEQNLIENVCRKERLDEFPRHGFDN